MDNIVLNGQVDIDEFRRVGIVGVNASHLRCRQEYIFRFFLFKEFLYRFLVCQIEFLVGTQDEVIITSVL